MAFQIDVFASFGIVRLLGRFVSGSLVLEDLFSYSDCRHGIWPSGVKGQVDDRFNQLILCYAVFARPREMRTELNWAVHSDESCNRYQASVTLRQLWALPNVSVKSV